MQNILKVWTVWVLTKNAQRRRGRQKEGARSAVPPKILLGKIFLETMLP